ncbi:MAG: type II toxin-antitoxin system VapC family toxin [Acidobacteriota bacterium]
MSGRYLLDTNVAIRVLNQDVDLEARRGLGIKSFLCLMVVGELLFGAAKSARPEANRRRIEGLVEVCPVMPQDIATAQQYGTLKAHLQQQGRPIPENDIWIAACARQHDLILATRDRHFAQVESLQVEAW